MTTQVDAPLSAVEDYFKNLIWNPEVAVAEAAVFAELPWLNFWPMNLIAKAIISSYANKLFGVIRLYTDVGAITLLNAEHQAAYVAASTKLRVVALDKGANSPEYQKAKDDATAALSLFVRFNQ